MNATPVSHLEPLVPVLGDYRTSGVVYDEAGAVSAEISGTDVYTLLPGGHWIAHEVDVVMGDQPALVHELIGGSHPLGGWQMHAFDAAESPGLMRLTLEDEDVLLLHGDGIRSWLRLNADRGHMTARWERDVDGRWLTWMDMRFDRS
ncbi:hypothetical protein CLV56_0963 [Mumia flava]|uniref:DUF1579 domain-containing protein n=1 Tax=Mumia flava TaxID=1348852 RepID=A0A0B2B2M1_9ACTN|nr:hypothetical protein [Mumia flava]PJJ56752.1 hypothetical protein CLV56_0963 [Mumia flava]